MLSETETKQKGEHLFSVTKGEKGWYLNEAGKELALQLGYPTTEEPMTQKKVSKCT